MFAQFYGMILHVLLYYHYGQIATDVIEEYNYEDDKTESIALLRLKIDMKK